MEKKQTSTYTINKSDLLDFNIECAKIGKSKNVVINNLISQFLSGKVHYEEDN